MLKMYVLYKAPDDAEAFEARYIDGHLPIVRGYGNVKDTTFSKVTRTLVGDFPYSYIFTGTWADKDGWKADLNSELAQKATEDAKSFAPDFDVVVVEELA
ncbi:MAG: EthD family reductase [Actinomycetota bacterium]|nr:EthD family reductase [Actinomycetota bacterium]